MYPICFTKVLWLFSTPWCFQNNIVSEMALRWSDTPQLENLLNSAFGGPCDSNPRTSTVFVWGISFTTVSAPHSYQWGVCYQKGLLCLVLPLCRVGVNIIFFQHTLDETRPALYKKKPPYMFEMKKNMFRPHLDMFWGVIGLPGKDPNESLHKTDCCNVLLDLWEEVCSAI